MVAEGTAGDDFAGFRQSSYWPQVRELLTRIWGEMVFEAARADGPGPAEVVRAHDRAAGAREVLRRVALAVEKAEAGSEGDETAKLEDEAAMRQFMLAQMRGA
jgi:hypothetical protein